MHHRLLFSWRSTSELKRPIEFGRSYNLPPHVEGARMSEIELEVFREEHYSPAQLGKLWGLSADYIRRRFANEPGVVILRSEKPGKRQYITLRIPASVAARVHAEKSLPSSLQR